MIDDEKGVFKDIKCPKCTHWNTIRLDRSEDWINASIDTDGVELTHIVSVCEKCAAKFEVPCIRQLHYEVENWTGRAVD